MLRELLYTLLLAALFEPGIFVLLLLAVAGATVLAHHFHSFGEGCGLTGVLVLSESHMTVHQWPEKGYAAFDVFMCGDAQPELSAKYIAESFSDSIVEVRSLDRCLPFES